jgi:hypothetical protein
MKYLKSSFLWFCLLVVGLIFFLPPIDTDLGWHLRYGEFFFKTLTVPRINFLTFFMPTYYWHNSYLGYQVLIFFIYKNFSLIGLSILYALIFMLLFTLFNAFNPKLTKFNFLFFSVSSYLSWHVLYAGIRAQVFSLLFLLLELFILKHSAKNRKRLLFLPLLIFVWANMHGSFIFGVLTYFIFIIKSNLEKKKDNLLLGAVLITICLTTLINPYGLGVYEEGIRHFIIPMNTLIAEWLGLNTIQIFYVVILFLSSSYVLLKKFKQSDILLYLLSLIFLLLSFKARRNVPYYVFSVALFFLDSFSKTLETLQEKPLIKILLVLTPFFVLTIFLLSANIQKTIDLDNNKGVYCTQGMLPYPCGAINYFQHNKLPGKNVFSSYEWGGYLEWQMPEYLYFVDGRTPAWKTPDKISPYTSYLKIIQAQPGFDDVLKNQKVDYLLIGANTFLDLDLIANPKSSWVEIFRDNISVIYRKRI